MLLAVRASSELPRLDLEDVQVFGVLDVDETAVRNPRWRLALVGRLALACRLGDGPVLQLHDPALLVGALEQQRVPVRELRVDDAVLGLEGLSDEIVEQGLRAIEDAGVAGRGLARAGAPGQYDLEQLLLAVAEDI